MKYIQMVTLLMLAEKLCSNCKGLSGGGGDWSHNLGSLLELEFILKSFVYFLVKTKQKTAACV